MAELDSVVAELGAEKRVNRRDGKTCGVRALQRTFREKLRQPRMQEKRVAGIRLTMHTRRGQRRDQGDPLHFLHQGIILRESSSHAIEGRPVAQTEIRGKMSRGVIRIRHGGAAEPARDVIFPKITKCHQTGGAEQQMRPPLRCMRMKCQGWSGQIQHRALVPLFQQAKSGTFRLAIRGDINRGLEVKAACRQFGPTLNMKGMEKTGEHVTALI